MPNPAKLSAVVVIDAAFALQMPAALLSTVSNSVSASTPSTTGSLIVDELFTGGTVPDPAWIARGRTCLTGAAAGTRPSPTVAICDTHRVGPVPNRGVTPGYLQLTDARNNTAGSILYNRAIPASAGISLTFEQYQYGGSGADGISFFLVDGATDLNKTGGDGGSLAYAQRTNADGIAGGYLGVGLDVFGNFYDVITRFIDACNENCHPFTWTKTADEILPHATVGQRTSFTRH